MVRSDWRLGRSCRAGQGRTQETTVPTFGGQAIYDSGRDLSSFAVTQGTDVAASEVLFVTRS
jgi:hypothetical protein